MPETGPSHRTGKSARNQGASGTSRDVTGKKKLPKSKAGDISPDITRKTKNVVDSNKKSDVDNVRASTSSRPKLKSDLRREASPSSVKVPETQVAPIRDLLMRANDKAAVRPKDPKPKQATPRPTARKSSEIDLEDARKKAAEAAMSRIDQSKNMGFVKDSSSKASHDQLAVQSVLHVCPVVSQEVLHSREWRPKIITYLTQLSHTEKELAAVLTIHTLNPSKEKVDECVQILTTYLKNILANPDEEKYRAIKTTNKVFSEKVLPIKGAVDFLTAAGFRTEEKTNDEGAEMGVMYLRGSPDMEKLDMLIDCLKSAEPVLPQVYRDPMILKPEEADEKIYLPDDFYDLTEKELTEMYKKNLKKIEDDSPLMTKAMRDKQERKHLVKYKYTVLRVRFPDSVILQGTFGRLDTQNCVKEFINSCLVRPFKYSLFCSITKSVLLNSNDNKTLLDLKLVPSVILNYIPDDKDKLPKSYLKPDLSQKIKRI